MTKIKLSEDDLQANCITWFRAQYKPYYWRMIAIPNGGKRSLIEAVKLKRTGTLAGAWDLFLSVPNGSYSGLFIELKVGRNKLTENQLEFLQANANDYEFAEVRSLDEFIKVIKDYLS